MPKKKNTKKLTLMIAAGVLLLLLLTIGVWGCSSAIKTFDGKEDVVIVIPENSTDDDIRDTLNARLGDYGTTVYRLWSLRGGKASKATGLYIIAPGAKAWSVASRIKDGRSSTLDDPTAKAWAEAHKVHSGTNAEIKLSLTNLHTFTELAETIAKYFSWSAADFESAVDKVLSDAGFKKDEYIAAFMPGVFEFKGSDSPDKVIGSILEKRNEFWTDERRQKAAALKLSPVEVTTLASIVEEESRSKDERPVIARLYLNRLAKGMRLQADPTVKYALGDFTLKRIHEKDTKLQSPWNTYRNKGLTPGPIRLTSTDAIDAVLNAPANDYIYMCAKPDNSGTHNFTADYNEHLCNADAYRKWLDELGM